MKTIFYSFALAGSLSLSNLSGAFAHIQKEIIFRVSAVRPQSSWFELSDGREASIFCNSESDPRSSNGDYGFLRIVDRRPDLKYFDQSGRRLPKPVYQGDVNNSIFETYPLYLSSADCKELQRFISAENIHKGQTVDLIVPMGGSAHIDKKPPTVRLYGDSAGAPNRDP